MIDRDLLIHSITAKEVASVDADRQKTYTETELSHVRVSADTKYVMGSEGAARADVLTLWFDCAESSPSGFVPKEGMGFTFEGKDYTAHGVRACCGTSASPAFYKVDLV